MSADGVLVAESFALRELQAVREVTHAFLVAERPEDVHQFALERVSPLLGASFSLVMMLDAAHEFLYPVAQHEWPEQYRAWIGALRVRVGQGPSGVAVAEKRVVHVADLHADAMLADWFDVATELGFRSIVAAPLIGSFGTLGAIAFYFADERHVTPEQRDLVRLIADQLAAATDKAQLIADLRRANAALAEANDALEAQSKHQHETQQLHSAFFDNFARAVLQVSTDVTTSADARGALARVAALSHAAQQLNALERDDFAVALSDIDPRDPLLAAVTDWRVKSRPLAITVGEPTVLLPTMRSDAQQLSRALHLGLGYAVSEALAAGSGVHADVELGRGFVAYRLQWTSAPRARAAETGSEPYEAPSDLERKSFDPFEALAHAVKRQHAVPASNRAGQQPSALDLPLARAIARELGGDVRLIAEEGEELAIESLSLIFPLDAAPDTSAALTRLSLPVF